MLAKYAGAYRLGPAGGDGRLSVVNGASVLHVTMLDMRLVPESERSFFVDDDPRTPVQFAIDASGKVTDLILLRNGTEQMRMPRVQ